MAFVDALNARGEIQAVPEHYLTSFPDQFKAVGSPEPAAEDPKPTPPANPGKPATPKES